LKRKVSGALTNLKLELENLKKIQQDEKDSKIKKPFSLKELSAILPTITEEFEKRKKKNTNALQKNRAGFAEVVSHPQFIANPLATIRYELNN
jgi:hypothetical protein